MNTILAGGSYLQCPELCDAAPQGLLTSICAHNDEPGSIGTSRRIWDLLETPQTVISICRVLSHERHVDPQALCPAVESLLAELYERDLIQLSPDT